MFSAYLKSVVPCGPSPTLSGHKHALFRTGTGFAAARFLFIPYMERSIAMTKVMTDLRGYTVREPENASTRTKLLAATAVVLGVVAVGAYAYTSHSMLPSAPTQQKTVASQPIPLTPPAQPAMSQPGVSAPAPQQTPAVQSMPAPEISAPAPQKPMKAQSSTHVAHVKARTTQPAKPLAVTPSDTTPVPATPPQTVTPNAETTSPYSAAPSATPPQATTPQTTVPDTTTNTTTQQPQATPDQSAPQTQSPQ